MIHEKFSVLICVLCVCFTVCVAGFAAIVSGQKYGSVLIAGGGTCAIVSVLAAAIPYVLDSARNRMSSTENAELASA